MIEVTFEEFEKNFDSYMDRIEQKGEEFLVRKSDGTAVVAVPVTAAATGCQIDNCIFRLRTARSSVVLADPAWSLRLRPR